MARATGEMRVGDLMSRRVTSAKDDDTVQLCHQVMLWTGVRHLPVLHGDEVVGLLSDRDLLHFAANGSDSAVPVRELMASPVEVAGPAEPVSEACARMAARRIDCLPVVEGGRLVGILTSSDVLAERGRLAHKDRTPEVPTVWSIARREPHALGPDAPLTDAISLMVENDIRHVPIVDSDRRVIGMLSDRDLRAKVGDPRRVLEEEEDELDLGAVDEAMTANPICVSTSASIYDVAQMFLDERVGAVPVIDEEERLVGIVSYVDLLAHLVGGQA